MIERRRASKTYPREYRIFLRAARDDAPRLTDNWGDPTRDFNPLLTAIQDAGYDLEEILDLSPVSVGRGRLKAPEEGKNNDERRTGGDHQAVPRGPAGLSRRG